MADPLGLINSPNNISQPAGLHGPFKPLSPQGPDADDRVSFKDVLMSNIEQVNRLQQDAEKAIEDLYSGRRDDVDGVLIAKQKADMAFQMLMQVRNKLVDAYDEIRQMRV